MSKKWGCALAVAGWLCTVPAQAVEIQFVAQDLADVTSGQDLWRYVYRVTGSFAAGSGFNVLFGPTYGALEDFPTAPNGDWMTSTTPPFAGADSLYTAIDNKRVTVLISLDLSAAFDTISDSILLRRLHEQFGVIGISLDWLTSYLSNRQHYVKIGRHGSSCEPSTVGVLQGSLLGPVLFAAYVSPVGHLVTSFSIEHHQYADDTQLFLAMRPLTFQTDLAMLQSCTHVVKQWFALNNLLLNPDKSEVIVFRTTAQLASSAASVDNVVVAGANLQISSQLKSLGVILDSRQRSRSPAITTYGHCDTFAVCCHSGCSDTCLQHRWVEA